MRLQELTLRFVRVPLIRPYVLSYRTYTAFDPIIVEARDADGRIGWGEGHISPGSSSETLEGGWAFCQEHAAAVVGQDTADAKAIIAAHQKDSKVAATALLTAIEMLEGHPLLKVDAEARLPLLTPFNSAAPGEIEDEVERRLVGRISDLQDQGRQRCRCRHRSRQGDPARDRRPRHHAAGCQPGLLGSRWLPFCGRARSRRHRTVRAAVSVRRMGRERECRQGIELFPSCWMSRSAPLKISSVRRPFPMSAFAS